MWGGPVAGDPLPTQELTGWGTCIPANGGATDGVWHTVGWHFPEPLTLGRAEVGMEAAARKLGLSMGSRGTGVPRGCNLCSPGWNPALTPGVQAQHIAALPSLDAAPLQICLRLGLSSASHAESCARSSSLPRLHALVEKASSPWAGPST